MEICDFLKNWKRMCNSMTEMDGCEDCPIVRNTHGARCGDMPGEMYDVESIAREVEKWAADNPEPKYPTWGEYLCNIGLIHDCTESEDVVLRLFNNVIPTEMAQKLGLQPKGET